MSTEMIAEIMQELNEFEDQKYGQNVNFIQLVKTIFRKVMFK